MINTNLFVVMNMMNNHSNHKANFLQVLDGVSFYCIKCLNIHSLLEATCTNVQNIKWCLIVAKHKTVLNIRLFQPRRKVYINQRTNVPVNAHLISWPSKAQNIQNLENIW